MRQLWHLAARQMMHQLAKHAAVSTTLAITIVVLLPSTIASNQLVMLAPVPLHPR